MVKIKKQIVSDSVINQRSYGYGNPINFITVHQTGNPNKGADAQAHANIQTNLNSRQASWHYSVDDKEVIQSFPDKVKCWHASDGRNGKGNTESIAIEICINEDGDYKKAVSNGAELVRHLLDKYDLDIDNVKQHADWYPKNCPAQLRAGKDGITWDDFLDMVKGSDDKKNVKTHTIKKGDTLYSIAKIYDTTVDKLKELNKGIDPQRLTIGSVIDIVDNGKSEPKKESKPKPQPKPEKKDDTKPLLEKGDKGKYVKELQQKLIELGYDLSKYGADSDFGNETLAATKAFQKDQGIAVDGKVGKVTWSKLESAKPKKEKVEIKEGAKVLLSKSADKYATGESIPSSIKGKTYTIQQVKSDRVLLKEIYSWVKIGDVGGSVEKKKSNNPYDGKELVVKAYHLRYYSSPSWSDKNVYSTKKKNDVISHIVGKTKVGSAYQWKFYDSDKKRHFWITANPKYITLR